MSNDNTFKQERHKTLQAIRDAMMVKMEALAKEGAKFTQADNLTMPEIIEVQEKFRWVPTTIGLAMELQQEKPLKEIFSRVSKRYESRRPPQATQQQLPADLAPVKGLNGRDTAFAEVRRALDIAERDFDMTYPRLTRDQVQWWLKKHPIGEESIRLAHKENQRHYMKAALTEVRGTLDKLEALYKGPPQTKKPSDPRFKL